MAKLLHAWSKLYDVIVIDSPPVSGVVDPLVLARFSTGVLMVIDSRHTRRATAHRAVNSLKALDLPITGIVFNRFKPLRRDRGYGYGYGYGYDS